MIIRLLIADDDTNLCRNLKNFFERQKYKVETVHDGAKALEIAEKFHPHLVFLDIGMPSLSGIEVLRQLKDKDPAVRVIMITGQAENELMRQARILGADDYITKPFTLEYLSGEVMDKLHKQLFYELQTTSAGLTIEREKAELLFEQVTEGVMLFDNQGIIFMANPVARKTLGLMEGDSPLTAQKIFENFVTDPPSDRLKHLDRETGEPFDLIREIPKRLILENRINSIFSRQKERFGYMVLFRDVTLERRAETAMHRFISLISHKLRTPLVTIRAYPPLLLSENAVSPLNTFQRNALQVISKECKRMEELVNQLIAFSSLEPEELMCSPITVSELLQVSQRGLADDLQAPADRIKLDPSLGKMKIQVDGTLMQHAFRNLIENAFKFGAKELRVAAKPQNDDIVVQFTDDGPGIPPEDIERVFDRFYQVENDFCGQVPGAGLGLSMVKQTVEAHGGHVWVESLVGKGSTFFVQLPAYKSN